MNQWDITRNEDLAMGVRPYLKRLSDESRIEMCKILADAMRVYLSYPQRLS